MTFRPGTILRVVHPATLGVCLSLGCARPPVAPPDLAAPALATVLAPAPVAPGVRLFAVQDSTGPWRSQVLELATRCVRVRAIKGSATAVGRRTTSDLLSELPSATAVAGVNADFFTFTPPGVPTGVHIEHGRLLAGPDARPAAWSDAEGFVHFDTLGVAGSLRRGRDALPIRSWNRPQENALGLVDAAWGQALAPALRRIAWRMAPLAAPRRMPGPAFSGRWRLVRPADSVAVQGDTLDVVLPPSAGAAWQAGDTVSLEVRITARRPVLHAVGGRPLLVMDSAVTGDVDTEGALAFRARNPRTVLGTSRDGQRQWLVVVDGRQNGAVGMTLRETADLLRGLGAVFALNLDGGGSSALAVRSAGTAGQGTVVNRPSDPTGERPVANAWAVVARCRAR